MNELLIILQLPSNHSAMETEIS